MCVCVYVCMRVCTSNVHVCVCACMCVCGQCECRHSISMNGLNLCLAYPDTTYQPKLKLATYPRPFTIGVFT